jgi:hypothetical protein
VIHESYYWKQPLLDSSKRFEEYQSFSDIDAETYVQIEKDIFIGFYSIRKLLDTDTKVTDDLKTRKHKLSWYKHIGDEVTWRNNHKLDELYEFCKTHEEERDLWFIASRIVHGFIFNIIVNENGGFDGILFTSDTDKNKKLYMLTVEQVIALFELVGNNDVTQIRWHRCPETGKGITSAT